MGGLLPIGCGASGNEDEGPRRRAEEGRGGVAGSGAESRGPRRIIPGLLLVQRARATMSTVADETLGVFSSLVDYQGQLACRRSAGEDGRCDGVAPQNEGDNGRGNGRICSTHCGGSSHMDRS